MSPPTKEWPMPVWHLGKKVLVYDSLPSTNDAAAALVAEQDATGIAVLAYEQTAGKGQPGRTWHSPVGGVYLSAILNPPEDLRRPVVLTAFASVAIAELIHVLTKKQAIIKWPNDVLVDDKKICGILIEVGKRAIVGVGFNVNQSTDEFVAANLSDATSLAEIAGEKFEIDHVARNVVLTLDKEYHQLLSGQLAELETRWKQLIGLEGESVTISTHDNRKMRGKLNVLTFRGMSLSPADGPELTLFPEQVRRIEAASD